MLKERDCIAHKSVNATAEVINVELCTDLIRLVTYGKPQLIF